QHVWRKLAPPSPNSVAGSHRSVETHLIGEEGGDGEAIDDFASEDHFDAAGQGQPDAVRDLVRVERVRGPFFKISAIKNEGGVIESVEAWMKIEERVYGLAA